VDRTREAVTSESLADRVQRMQVALERYADEGEGGRGAINRKPPAQRVRPGGGASEAKRQGKK
jgi:hypothetical protein